MRSANYSPMMAILALVLFAVTAIRAQDEYGYSDLRGPYCAARYPKLQCCGENREDECNVPIIGTTCYCDEFCNNTARDCCPDYWSHCKGLAPLEPLTLGCSYKRNDYRERETIKENCNQCTCTSVGNSVKMVCDNHPCIVDPEVIKEVNQFDELGWRAANHTEFWGRKLEEGLTLKLGTLEPREMVRRTKYKVHRRYDLNRIPRSFDSRDVWGNWISGIRDQGWCGASWATSTVDVATDRFAIMSKGKEIVQLSAQNLLSCNRKGQQGCHGGHLDRAWMHLRKTGVVDEACYPWTGTTEKCKLPKGTTLQRAGCQVPWNSRRTQLYTVMPVERMGNETDIMAEILLSGPVQATMKVYQDFFVYKSGVYRHSRNAEKHRTGYHSVRIIGWGEERNAYGQPLKYWIVANSWGSSWGENGYFRIVRGINECEIEEFVLAAWAKIRRDI